MSTVYLIPVQNNGNLNRRPIALPPPRWFMARLFVARLLVARIV